MGEANLFLGFQTGGPTECGVDTLDQCNSCTINPDCFNPCDKDGCELCFLDGWAGLQVNVLQACYICLKEAKLWELDHALAQPNPEADGPERALQLFSPPSQEADVSHDWAGRRSVA